MKRAVIISMIAIMTLSLSACANKNNDLVIIEAQDEGKDTSKNELVKGDSAGKAESEITVEDKKEQEIIESEEVEGFHPDTSREIQLLGEWECTDGSKWVLDNGYNLTYNGPEGSYIGSYGYSYYSTEGNLGFNFWNVETSETVNEKDAEGNVTGTHEFKSYKSGNKNYTILSYDHNDDYTTGTLKLKTDDGKEVTATLTKPIAVDRTVTSAAKNKKEFDKKVKEAKENETAARKGMTTEEYKARKEQEHALKKELEAKAKEAGLSLVDYMKQTGETYHLDKMTDEHEGDTEGEPPVEGEQPAEEVPAE